MPDSSMRSMPRDASSVAPTVGALPSGSSGIIFAKPGSASCAKRDATSSAAATVASQVCASCLPLPRAPTRCLPPARFRRPGFAGTSSFLSSVTARPVRRTRCRSRRLAEAGCWSGRSALREGGVCPRCGGRFERQRPAAHRRRVRRADRGTPGAERSAAGTIRSRGLRRDPPHARLLALRPRRVSAAASRLHAADRHRGGRGGRPRDARPRSDAGRLSIARPRGYAGRRTKPRGERRWCSSWECWPRSA